MPNHPGTGFGTRGHPPLLSGGGGSNVTEVEKELSPASAGDIAIPSSGSAISGGMFDGWKFFDPDDCVVQTGSASDTMLDGSTTFDIGITDGAGNDYRWFADRRAAAEQPRIVWPNRIMGDFSIEVKFTMNGSTSGGTDLSQFNLFVYGVPANNYFNHTCGIYTGSWASTTAYVKCGCMFGTHTKTTNAGSTVSTDSDLWLKLVRTEHLITGSYRVGDSGSFTELESQAMDIGGAASYIGIGWHNTTSADTDIWKIYELNLNAYEYTAEP